MVLKTRNGFQLSGHVNGTVAPPAHRYQKSTVDGQDSVIFVGDPIALASAGTVTRLHQNDNVSGTVNSKYLGVCTGIFETEQGRPLTHRTNKWAATADSFWIDVIDDPDTTWEVSYGLSAAQTDIGSLTYVMYASANQQAGISGAGFGAASAAATAVAAGFRVIGIQNLNLDGQTNDQDGVVRVIAVNHIFRSVETY